jgi:hypothetical protein
MLVLAMQFSRSWLRETQGGLGEVLTRCAGGPKKRTGQRAPEGAPVPFLQNGIVMTDESRLG